MGAPAAVGRRQGPLSTTANSRLLSSQCSDLRIAPSTIKEVAGWCIGVGATSHCRHHWLSVASTHVAGAAGAVLRFLQPATFYTAQHHPRFTLLTLRRDKSTPDRDRQGHTRRRPGPRAESSYSATRFSRESPPSRSTRTSPAAKPPATTSAAKREQTLRTPNAASLASASW